MQGIGFYMYAGGIIEKLRESVRNPDRRAQRQRRSPAEYRRGANGGLNRKCPRGTGNAGSVRAMAI